MKIEKGYNDKPTTIKIDSQDNGSIEIWIEETGRIDEKTGLSKETLSYMTADELLALHREVKLAGKELFG